jgi:hypothetical protein
MAVLISLLGTLCLYWCYFTVFLNLPYACGHLTYWRVEICSHVSLAIPQSMADFIHVAFRYSLHGIAKPVLKYP